MESRLTSFESPSLKLLIYREKKTALRDKIKVYTPLQLEAGGPHNLETSYFVSTTSGFSLTSTFESIVCVLAAFSVFYLKPTSLIHSDRSRWSRPQTPPSHEEKRFSPGGARGVGTRLHSRILLLGSGSAGVNGWARR